MFNTLTTTQKGMILALTGYSGFALSDVCVKIVSQHHDIWQVVCMIMGISAFIMVCLYPWIGQGHAHTSRKKMLIHGARGICNLLVSACFVTALAKLAMTTVYTFVFTMPFFAILISMGLYREHANIQKLLTIVLGFIGIVIAMRPGTDNFDILLFYPIIAAFFSALLFTLSKSLEGESIFKLGFYPAFITSILSIPFAYDVFAVPSLHHLPFFILSGFGITIGMVSVTLAYKTAAAAVVSPFQYSQMLWGLTAGALIFGNFPDRWEVIGSAVIIISGLLLIWQERAER